MSNMELLDWLDDLCVRFIINLPSEELQEAERICFQIEEAQWFYEDFIRPLDPENLPSLNLHNFYMLISRHCPMLSDFPGELHEEAFQRFLAYKTRVPVRGAIMLNEKMDEVVLVKGWKKNANWSFPRGKINKEEEDLDCAIREVYEETGFDLRAAGLVPDDENLKSIEIIMREQHMKLFVFRNVPSDTNFEPRTRKEISKIQWYKISELPTVKKNKQQHEGKGENLAGNANKFYMVAPFLGHLKRWIGQQRRQDKSRSISQPSHEASKSLTDVPTDTDDLKLEEPKANDQNVLSIMHLLQKPEKPQPSDLPEVSTNAAPMITSVARGPASDQHASQTEAPPDKADLLALLWSGTSQKSEAPPHTPAAQVIEQPKMPHSPPHHHLSRIPTSHVLKDSFLSQIQRQPDKEMNIRIPEARPAPPLTEPARLVPQTTSRLQKKAARPPQQQRTIPAPYQLTGDHFIRDNDLFGGEQSAVPQASKLPPPKITPHTANLLNLFKTQKSPTRYTQESAKPTNGGEVANPSAMASSLLVPSQVSPVGTSQTPVPARPMSGQKADLLDLFRKPSIPKGIHGSELVSSLHLPTAPAELSAMPTPGHSRETSQNRSLPQGDVTLQLSRPSITIKKRPEAVLSTLPVSATISGPLNAPHFETIAKQSASKDRRSMHKAEKSEEKPQITILSRHANSGAVTGNGSVSPKPTLEADATATEQLTARQGKPLAVRSPAVTPVKIQQPPPPILEARTGPPKQFQPQILRRSARRPTDLDEPSPIQPLPSPRHNLHTAPALPLNIATRPSNEDHKKSLLSLFTSSKQSPAISPVSAAPRATGSIASALISPIIGNERPAEDNQQQSQQHPFSLSENAPLVSSLLASALTAPIPLQQQQEESKKARQIPEPLTLKNNATQAEAPDSSIAASTLDRTKESVSGSGKQTPNETRDKLLGYLANIKA